MPKDIDEHEKIKDELDAEVEQKFEKLHESKGENSEDEEDYEDDEEFNNSDNDLKEDTIKTDKIEQIVEEDMRKDKLDKELNVIEEYSYKDEETKSDVQK